MDLYFAVYVCVCVQVCFAENVYECVCVCVSVGIFHEVVIQQLKTNEETVPILLACPLVYFFPFCPHSSLFENLNPPCVFISLMMFAPFQLLQHLLINFNIFLPLLGDFCQHK